MQFKKYRWVSSIIMMSMAIGVGSFTLAQNTEIAVNDQGMEYIPGELIIKFESGEINLQKPHDVQILSQMENTQDFDTTQILAKENIALVAIDEAKNMDAEIARISQDQNVEYVQPNYIYHIQMADPNDQYFGLQRGLKNIGQTILSGVGLSGADIQRNEAMDIRSGDGNPLTTGTIVAVLDVGVEYTHPDLVHQMWNGINCLNTNGAARWWCLWWWYNAYLGTKTAAVGNHGTHVAGIIWAEMNNLSGVVGVNPHAKIMNINLGNGEAISTAAAISALSFAKYNGAKIANLSRWWTQYGCSSYDTALYTAIKGFPWLVVIAAGNESTEHTGTYFFYPADFSANTSCRSWLDNIISVAASDSNDHIASFSDYGQKVNIAAPWDSIASTYINNGYQYMDGTSMASPMVAGAVSLARSMRPDLGYLDIKNAIINNAEYVSTLSGYVSGGKRLNIYTTLMALNKPTATIVYSTTWWTTWMVIATVTWFNETITWLNTGNYIFTWNGNFVFTFNDLAGNTWSVTATVTWIDGITPIITIASHIHNQQITGTSITLTWSIIDSWSLSGLYIDGFYFSGLVGNAPASWSWGWSASRCSGNNYGYSIWSSYLIGWNRSRTLSLPWGVNTIILTWYDKAGNIITTGINIIRINYVSGVTNTVLSWTSAKFSFTTDIASTWFIVYWTSSLNTAVGWGLTTGHNIIINWLSDNTVYYYRVYGINDGYTGTYSATWTFTTPKIINTSNIVWTVIVSWEVQLWWATNTGIIFHSTWIVIINSTWNTNNSLQINTSWFIIQTSWWLWDGIVMPPTQGANPALGIWWLPSASTNNWSTTITRAILLTMQAWSIKDSLIASGWYFTLHFVISSWTSGDVVQMYRSENWTTWTGITSCILDSNKICSFTTDHLSFFSSIKETTNTNWWWGWWGGGWWGGGWWASTLTCTPTNLICTNSIYILKAWANCQWWNLGASCSVLSWSTGANIHTTFQTSNIGSSFSTELNTAYTYAYSIGITTIPSIQQANMTGTLIRKHFAKMISIFAIKQIKSIPNTWLICNFTDMDDENTEMKFYVKTACQLGLMWLDAKGVPVQTFNPNEEVTRAQFGTVLSRTLRGNQYNGGEPFYMLHLNALQKALIMKKIDTPANKELRWYVMLMLMRSIQ